MRGICRRVVRGVQWSGDDLNTVIEFVKDSQRRSNIQFCEDTCFTELSTGADDHSYLGKIGVCVVGEYSPERNGETVDILLGALKSAPIYYITLDM